MTYDQLVTLEMIIKEGSFKAAAKALFKTQPSLSAAIKKLEEEYQIKLFSRDSYRPELTPEGRAFYNSALPALETYRELEKFAKQLAMGEETEITLSMDAICPLEKVSPILKDFFNSKVVTSLNLNIDILEGLMESILEHRSDFAIGSYISSSEGIEALKLFDVCMVPVIHPDLLQNGKTTLWQLKRHPHIIVRSSSKKSSQKIVGSVTGAKKWFTSDIYMKEQLILSGLGWGRLPLHQVEKHLKDGKLIEIKGLKEISKIDVPMHLLKSKTKNLGPNAQRLWQVLLDTCQN